MNFKKQCDKCKKMYDTVTLKGCECAQRQENLDSMIDAQIEASIHSHQDFRR